MADLKLARLPDRTPIKLTISVLPELHQRSTIMRPPMLTLTEVRSRSLSWSRRCCRRSSKAIVSSLEPGRGLGDPIIRLWPDVG